MATTLLGPTVAGIVTAIILACALATLISVISADLPATKGEACRRKCVDGDKKICKFLFEVETYQTLSRACHSCPLNATDCELPDCLVGDGTTKFIYVVNKKLPGPAIEVCEGDTVIVDVHNHLPSAGVTFHWHGLLHADSVHGPPSPHMDGVPGVTQCDIPSRGRFSYKFLASVPGTYWWHSHTGFQRGDGLFGPLIIRRAHSSEPNNHLYDYDLSEHVIMFHDWIHMPTAEKFALRHYGGDDDFPDNILVNGHGRYQDSHTPRHLLDLPFSRFNILKGDRYRLRLINAAALNCPINVEIQGHLMTIISTDGHDVMPFNTTSLVIYPGERFDVVVKGAEVTGLYWITFNGLVDCEETEAHQLAVLQVHDEESYSNYQSNNRHYLSKATPPGKPSYTTDKSPGVQVNSPNSGCYEDKKCISELRNTKPMPGDVKKPTADHTFYLAFTMRMTHNQHFYDKNFYSIESLADDKRVPSPQVNNISHLEPLEPLLTAAAEPGHVCHSDAMPEGKDCRHDYCECLHLLKVSLGDVVDIVLIDEGPHSDEGHPVHLHGFKFWVLGQDRPKDEDDVGITREAVINMDKKGQLKRNLDHPVLKDTVTVPDAGYTIIRFHADNPGYWLLHCHLIFHSMAGMSVVIQVGEHDQMPSAPPNFPTCHHYMGS